PLAYALARYGRLDADERRVVRWAVAMMAGARVALREAGVGRLRRAAARVAPATGVAPARLAHLVDAAACALPGTTTCLPRAIALEALVAATGRTPELRIGLAPRE